MQSRFRIFSSLQIHKHIDHRCTDFLRVIESFFLIYTRCSTVDPWRIETSPFTVCVLKNIPTVEDTRYVPGFERNFRPYFQIILGPNLVFADYTLLHSRQIREAEKPTRETGLQSIRIRPPAFASRQPGQP